MHQMMPGSRTHPSGQPAAHVRAPVNFFKSNVVEREACKHSRCPEAVKHPLQEQKWDGVRNEKRYDSPGVAGKVYVTRGFRRVQRGVVHHVLLAEDAAA